MMRPIFRHSLARVSCRSLATSFRLSSRTTPWATGPAPPRLPKEEQELFEELQRRSTGAFSTPTEQPAVTVDQTQLPQSRPQVNQSPHSAVDVGVANEALAQPVDATVPEGDELHPDIYRGARPEFEGDKNPKTGEIGGPKNEPLRWGHEGDWSYNGRVTDF